MKVGVYFPESNDEHIKMLAGFAYGLRECKVDLCLYSIDDYHDTDIAVVFGIGKRDVPISWPRGKIIAEQHKREKPVIVIEKGFVKRDEYYMVGFDGLNNRAMFNNGWSKPDRWEQLGVELKPWRNNGENIIVCGQVPTDASVQNIDIFQWCVNTIKALRKVTDRNIIFRPHPLAIDRTPSIIGATMSTKSFEDDLKNAYAVVTYNSNAAVEAVIAGIPAFSFDMGSMAFLVTSHDLADINNPLVPTDNLRNQWAHNLAYTQWNLDEFRQGLPWKHLTDGGANNAA